MFYIPDSYLSSLIQEDLQFMDLTVMALGIENVPAKLSCFPKTDCTLAGVEEAARVLRLAGAEANVLLKSGTDAAGGSVCLQAEGSAGAIHGVYKLAQNIMEYSSAIATRTKALVTSAQAANPNTRVAVTRKNFPGTKALSLKAALAGGAGIHRLGLSDSILVFDQHRVMTDDFLTQIAQMKKDFPEKQIAAEAENAAEGLAYIAAGVDSLQCERVSPAELAQFVKEAKGINPQVTVLAAGGINSDNAAAYATAGADVLVTSWVYFGKPQDIKMSFSRG